MAHTMATPVVNATQPYRFIIVDDHPLFRGALAQVLGSAFKGSKIDEAGLWLKSTLTSGAVL